MFTTKNNPKIISVRYLRNNETAPVYMASVGGGEIGNHQGNYTDVDVQLNDARASSWTCMCLPCALPREPSANPGQGQYRHESEGIGGHLQVEIRGGMDGRP